MDWDGTYIVDDELESFFGRLPTISRSMSERHRGPSAEGRWLRGLGVAAIQRIQPGASIGVHANGAEKEGTGIIPMRTTSFIMQSLHPSEGLFVIEIQVPECLFQQQKQCHPCNPCQKLKKVTLLPASHTNLSS